MPRSPPIYRNKKKTGVLIIHQHSVSYRREGIKTLAMISEYVHVGEQALFSLVFSPSFPYAFHDGRVIRKRHVFWK